MEIIIPLLVIIFLAGSIGFLRPSKKMKFLAELRVAALKLGFKINSSITLKNKFKNMQPNLVLYQIRNTTSIENYGVTHPLGYLLASSSSNSCSRVVE